jgi:class 3 adenylate cyclase/DNA polymerase III delta prime subunit
VQRAYTRGRLIRTQAATSCTSSVDVIERWSTSVSAAATKVAGRRVGVVSRTVTLRDGTWSIVFTDLVGSTEQRTRLGDDAADELRREHDAIVSEAVTRHDGEIVKGTGDGMMAAFSGAAEALACTVAIQQGIERRNRRAADIEPLGVRVGASLGDARLDAGDLFGTAVIEARRLCDLAGTGEIFCADVVKVVAGSRAVQDFESIGALELKGIPDAVASSRIAWTPITEDDATSSGVPPLPPGLDPGTRFAFVGRSEQLDTAVERWKGAAEGERGVVLFAGEPGIGKTRLAMELAALAHGQGATVMFGRCDDELGVPFQPFVEALSWDVDHAAPEALAARLGRYGGELGRLVPGLTDRVRGLDPPLQSDPETEQYRLFEAVAGWLAAASRDSPVLLVLDDLHWAAKPTLLMLRHLTASAEDMRLLVVGTYRDTDLDRGHPLSEVLADLRRRDMVDRVPLIGLDEQGVVEFLEQTAGHELDERGRALAGAIHAETEGNPLFVGEVLRHLAETGRVYERDGRWTTDDPSEVGIPEGVREVIGRRLNQLSDATNDALTLASVIGRAFELRILAGLSDLDEDGLEEVLDEAVTFRLVREVGVGSYEFSHALVRSALYDEIRPTRLARLHGTTAETIERVHAQHLDRHLAELAHHYARASGDSAKALEYCLLAADHALDQRAPDEAVSYYEQARELLDDADVTESRARCEVLLGLGVAKRRAGVAGYREVLLEAADLAARIGESELLVRTALANNRGFFSAVGAVDEERVAMVRSALAVVGDADTAERARLLANLAGEVVFSEPLDGRRAISDEALALARRLDDPAALVHVLIARSVALWDPSTLDERLGITAECVEIAVRLRDPYLEFFAAWYRHAACMEHGDAAELQVLGARLQELASEVGQATPVWMEMFTRAGRHMSAAEHDAGEELMTAQLEAGERAGQPDAVFFYGVLLFSMRLNQGRLEEIVDLARVAVDDSPVTGIEVMLAITLLESGRPDEARLVFDRILQTGLAELPRNQILTSILWAAAFIADGLGDTATAVMMRDLLTPYLDHLVYNGLVSFGSIASAAGLMAAMVGNADEAIELFERGIAMEEAVGHRASAANSRWWCARTLVARDTDGDRARAEELASEVVTAADELGFARLGQQASQLLA